MPWGAPLAQTLPDGREITFTYDANGNVTSITPPGRSAHGFTYTGVDLTQNYLTPSVSNGGSNTTSYAYNADRQVNGVTRPDGQQIMLADRWAAGPRSSQTLPTGAPRARIQ